MVLVCVHVYVRVSIPSQVRPEPQGMYSLCWTTKTNQRDHSSWYQDLGNLCQLFPEEKKALLSQYYYHVIITFSLHTQQIPDIFKQLDNNYKELFENAPTYIDNLTLWKRVPLIYHTKGLPCQVKILYPVRKNTLST